MHHSGPRRWPDPCSSRRIAAARSRGRRTPRRRTQGPRRRCYHIGRSVGDGTRDRRTSSDNPLVPRGSPRCTVPLHSRRPERTQYRNLRSALDRRERRRKHCRTPSLTPLRTTTQGLDGVRVRRRLAGPSRGRPGGAERGSPAATAAATHRRRSTLQRSPHQRWECSAASPRRPLGTCRRNCGHSPRRRPRTAAVARAALVSACARSASGGNAWPASG